MDNREDGVSGRGEAVGWSRGALWRKRSTESSGIQAVSGSPYRALGGTVLRGGDDDWFSTGRGRPRSRSQWSCLDKLVKASHWS